MKLTLVSIAYLNCRISVFMPLPVVNGEVLADYQKLFVKYFPQVPDGCTFTLC